MEILGWVGDGDPYGSDRAEDHAPKADRVKKIGYRASGWVAVTEGRVSSPVYAPQGGQGTGQVGGVAVTSEEGFLLSRQGLRTSRQTGYRTSVRFAFA